MGLFGMAIRRVKKLVAWMLAILMVVVFIVGLFAVLIELGVL